MQNRMTDPQTGGHWLDPTPLTEADSPEEAAAAAMQQGRRIAEKFEQVITSHPAAALGVAVAAGVALGWWIKRK